MNLKVRGFTEFTRLALPLHIYIVNKKDNYGLCTYMGVIHLWNILKWACWEPIPLSSLIRLFYFLYIIKIQIAKNIVSKKFQYALFKA